MGESGEIERKYLALGGPASLLGRPRGRERACPDGVGRYRHYQGGSIHWHPDRGAFETHGAIRAAWKRMRWERGPLGYPLSDETDWRLDDFAFGREDAGIAVPAVPALPALPAVLGRRSRFQGGWLLWHRELDVCLQADPEGTRFARVGRKAPVWSARFETFAEHYSERGFGERLAQALGKISRHTLQELLILYFGLSDPEVPDWAKSVIVAALGYFIFPLDLIPDVIPVLGLVDDALVIAAAYATVRMHVGDATVERACRRVEELLGLERKDDFKPPQ